MLVEAGFVSLIRTLLVFAAIYYGFRLIFRFLVPYLLKRFIQRQTGAHSSGFSNHTKPEGEVNINSHPKKESKSDQLGDYVDYEEIKESDKS